MRAPGVIRDAIVEFLTAHGKAASVAEIENAVQRKLGAVSPSSVRSYLRLNATTLFEKKGRGQYAVKDARASYAQRTQPKVVAINDSAELVRADCFDWLADRAENSVHAVVTDPPYGLIEYTEKEQGKLRNGKGGVWRIPPSFDGHQRAPLPRFTVLDEHDRRELYAFFKRFAMHIARVLVPGGNVVIASNPLLSHIVATSMAESGLELRGYIARLTMTMRGGDRPKNAHNEFWGVSVMPRSMWEPWVILRKPPEGRVQDNLRRWKTGGFRRPSDERPFGDVLRSGPTSKTERDIAAHPSLKPQAFMREIVRAALPLGQGVVLDPFMGAGSTIAAAMSLGYSSIGVELDPRYFDIAVRAVPRLAILPVNRATSEKDLGGGAGGVTKGLDRVSYQKGRRPHREGSGRVGGPLL
ncbi:MAG: site-specific DNA-methyltransferase [Alphaproteobacteria bacterium]|nr:site-specific DNA-methyltransferase [Alphaproteobacteria bacterium]MCW5741574.1 site-specific DNA-methyltransferase [Alphaproteobacteria bacterium]